MKVLPPDVVSLLSDVAELRLGLLPDEKFSNEVVDAEAIFLESREIDENILKIAKKLRIIALDGVGYDHVDVEACTRHGVYVTNTPGVLSDAVADLTVAFMLCLSRDLVEADRYSRVKWASEGELQKLGFDLEGKVCGIIGLGRIGFEVAKRVHAFGMRILYYDMFRNKQAESQFGATFAELDRLLKESDYVTLHVFLGEKTRGMIGRRELSLMKNTAYIVNTSRGAVIDQSALVEFLRTNRIAGAGLDVFEKEPIPSDDPILKLDNVILAPHIGSATVETRHAMALTAANDILAVLKGEVPSNPVLEQKDKVFLKK